MKNEPQQRPGQNDNDGVPQMPSDTGKKLPREALEQGPVIVELPDGYVALFDQAADGVAPFDLSLLPDREWLAEGAGNRGECGNPGRQHRRNAPGRLPGGCGHASSAQQRRPARGQGRCESGGHLHEREAGGPGPIHPSCRDRSRAGGCHRPCPGDAGTPDNDQRCSGTDKDQYRTDLSGPRRKLIHSSWQPAADKGFRDLVDRP